MTTDAAPTTSISATERQFLIDCPEYVTTMAYVGNEKWLAVWNYLGQDEASLIDYCEQVAEAPDEFTAVRTEIERTERFFAAAAKAESSAMTTNTTAARTPNSSYPRVAPRISLDCGGPVTGDWDWYRVVYGYSVDYLAPIVEFGMRYGDGKGFVAYDASTAQSDLFWHTYRAPGSYAAEAWVVDTNGLRAEASCNFTWNGVALSSPDDSGDSGWVNGDLDCEDIGEEVWVGDDDPDGLDGDGDGWGCEGW